VKRIWLSVKECFWRGGKLDMTPHSPRLPNFAALQKVVENLPARSLLFYDNDDVPPITEALTGKDKLLLDQILRSKEGRLYCFPGG
jgi:hypothetical protein